MAVRSNSDLIPPHDARTNLTCKQSRRNELDSALLDQLDGDNTSSFRDVDSGRKSFGGANTVMTYGDVPSHPYADEDDYHEPEFSQPTQYPFATPADEAKEDEEEDGGPEKQQPPASPTLELDNADIQPPPAKRQKLSALAEPSPLPAAAPPKTATGKSLDSDLVESSDDDSLLPVTQRPTQPPKKPTSNSAESDHDSDEAPSHTATKLDHEEIESTLQITSEKPKETWKQKTSAPPAPHTEDGWGAKMDDEIIMPQISSDEDEEPAPPDPARSKSSKSAIELVEDEPEIKPQQQAEKPPKSDPKRRNTDKNEEEERPPLSKFLDRRGNKGHKLEEPEKPKKQEQLKEPSKPKKASNSVRSPPKKAQPQEDDDDDAPVVRKKKDAFAFETMDDIEDENNDDKSSDDEPAPKTNAKTVSKTSRAKPKKSRDPSPPPKRAPSKKRKRYQEDDDDDESESEMSEEPSEEIIVQPTLPDEEEAIDDDDDAEFINKLQAEAAAVQKQTKPAPKKKVQAASTLFKNMFFIVTGIKDCPEISATELKERIESHGGKIVNKKPLNHRPRHAHGDIVPSVVLISDTEQRTYKYIMALATCVPCLNYRWVLQCLDSNSIVDPKPHLLNAGIDFNKKAHKQPEWVLDEDAANKMEDWEYGVFFVKKKGADVPEAARIEVVGVPEFKAQWTEIIKAAGAKATKDRLASEGSKTNITYILSDSQPTQHTVDSCQRLKVPLCGHEWVIQCLIAHRCMDPFTDPSLTLHTDQE